MKYLIFPFLLLCSGSLLTMQAPPIIEPGDIVKIYETDIEKQLIISRANGVVIAARFNKAPETYQSVIKTQSNFNFLPVSRWGMDNQKVYDALNNYRIKKRFEVSK